MSRCPEHLKRVFVSGEDGLLARELIRRLRELDDCHILNDDFFKDWRNPAGWDPEVNVLSPGNMLRLECLKPSTIIHTAALVNTDKCDDDEEAAFFCNVKTAYNLARARPEGCYFVHFGTTAVYDPEEDRPLDEDSRVAPHTLYGKTKWWGEQVVQDLVHPNRLMVLRPCFVYGGARDTSSVLAKLVRQGLTGEPKEVVATLDASKYKDFLWVEDFGEIAFELIAQKWLGLYNVVRGKPRIYADALAILRQIGLQVNVRFEPEKDYLGDHVVNGEQALSASGVTPTVDLEQGIRMLVRQMGEQIHGFR